ncbi:MAG: hypothetical protein IKE70_04750 [Bacilli bacterium]|nr:hypothetical protein [Bacilli bacterium]
MEEKELEKIIKNVDDIELIPDNELENMDFYDLAYYIQTLNSIENIGKNEKSEDEE